MKILSIGNFGYGWDGSICDEVHIANALEELGHEVIRQQREERVYKFPEDIDFILVSQWDGYNPYLKEAARKTTEAPIVYWAFDYQADGQEWHERLVNQADLYLSKRIADSKYPNWRWCSQDFAPNFLMKYPDYHETHKGEIDVLFTGSYLPWATERNEILKLVDDHYNLVIHSVNGEGFKELGFKDVRGPIMDEGLPELYNKAKIVLSVDHTHEAGYWSDRNAQAIACGAFVLFRHVPLSEAIFRSNIAYFWGKGDVLDAIDHWLDRDEDRGVIAAEGYQNSEYYKVTMRVNDMLNIVKELFV